MNLQDQEQEANVSEDDMECESCNPDTEIDAQDNETHNVLQAIQTQEEDKTPPTLASRDEPETITVSQDVNGDPERDTTTQTDETISATQDHLEPCPLHQTLAQDESKKVRQPKEKDEKHGKRARKRTKSHKAIW
jgi:hypothetical protein